MLTYIMKKILTILLTILLIGFQTPFVYAQEETTTTGEETLIEQTTEEKETALEEAASLAETLNTTTETVETKSLTFGTILIATLTPALFIIISYMLIKFFKQ